MVTTYGSSSSKLRIGDHGTPGSGTYQAYFDPQGLNIPIDIVGIGEADASEVNIHTTNGTAKWRGQFRHIHQSAATDTNWDNLLIMVQYWNRNNTLLYLNLDNGKGYEIGKFPNAAGVMTQLRVKIEQITIQAITSESITIRVILKRVTK